MDPSKPLKPSKKKHIEEFQSSMVGCIVEKGFSSSFSAAAAAPRPSVLPFPVARHRSQGPHWTPAVVDKEKDENDVDEADDKPVPAEFAIPVQRKEKKTLDLSRWREMVSSDGTVKPKSKKEVKGCEGKRNDGMSVQPMLVEEEAVMDVGMKRRVRERVRGVSEVVKSSLDDIDVENLTRLKEMTPEEIAEAQAEIMERIDPAKLEMLKKRGLGKLGGKKGAGSDRFSGREGPRASRPIEESKRAKTEASSGDSVLTRETNSNSWKAWSERVEKVRGLRFSLDGNVVEGDPAQERLSGNDPDVVQYSVENVAERDLLRTEGDPAAVGYTIKEALSLIRSLVPGQRKLALQILAFVFNKALHNLQQKDAQNIEEKTNPADKPVDWQAVWAFSLGPEPEMALSLRMAIDDNNDYVVLACAKVIQCVLSCDINENFFDVKEKIPTHDKNICTASVFRSKPEIAGDLLHGGYWKYNTKPSNILPYNNEDEGHDEDNEGNNTSQDDIFVAGQDVAAGLVRMGILPRICFLLEMDPHPSLEECLVSILAALARHSRICANAIMRCPRLIQAVAKIFTKEGKMVIHPSQIKAIIFLKVLAQSSKKTCFDFVKCGIVQQAMWHLYREAFTLDQWINLGKEQCKLTSAMLVEELRLWKVCIRYGYCITSFTECFRAMCLWLSPPAFEKLNENNVLCAFASVTREAYLVLGALSERLPNLHSVEQLNKEAMDISDDSVDAWSWSHVVPMVDVAIKWLSLKKIPFISSLIGNRNEITTVDPSLPCMLWAVSAVLHMLSSIFDRIPPYNIDGSHNSSSHLPWLPQFVPEVGLELVRNGFLRSSDLEPLCDNFQDGRGSLMEGICHLRLQNDSDASLSSVSFFLGLVRLAFSVDSCVQRARNANSAGSVKTFNRETAEEILEEGIINYAQNDLLRVLSLFMSLISSEWHVVQSVEIFGRGGTAPGVGVGWGSSDGGFWSFNILLFQMDAELVIGLLEIFHTLLEKDLAVIEGMKPAFEGSTGSTDLTIQRINAVLCVCLTAGPGDRVILEKAFDILLQPSVLKYLDFCAHYYFNCLKGFKSLDWQYKEEDYLLFSKTLNSHFRDRWLTIKQKSSGKTDRENHNSRSRNGDPLETINEDLEMLEMTSKSPDQSSLLIEWAHQRLPLPVHWFLSSVCSSNKSLSKPSPSDIVDVTSSGLFFLLGLESFSSLPYFDSKDSPIAIVPLVWKLHALSVALHVRADVLEDEKTRSVFETLQELYGQHLDNLRNRNIDPSLATNEQSAPSSASLLESQENGNLELLHFQGLVHESYSTFIENIIQQFGAESYGDITFGRQIALYLHSSVEASLRLVTWTMLSNAQVHGSLPPLEKCIAEAEGYLEPAEQNEGILEAYTKSWVSGALDRAAARGSISFTLALHHLSSLIFRPSVLKVSLRNKLAKLLLRSYSQKPHQRDMLLDLVRYRLGTAHELQHSEIERRFELLKQTCDGNSSLLAIAENLRSSV